MNKIKILALIAIIIGAIGIFFSVFAMFNEPGLGLVSFLLYGFMLWFGIEVKIFKK